MQIIPAGSSRRICSTKLLAAKKEFQSTAEQAKAEYAVANGDLVDRLAVVLAAEDLVRFLLGEVARLEPGPSQGRPPSPDGEGDLHQANRRRNRLASSGVQAELLEAFPTRRSRPLRQRRDRLFETALQPSFLPAMRHLFRKSRKFLEQHGGRRQSSADCQGTKPRLESLDEKRVTHCVNSLCIRNSITKACERGKPQSGGTRAWATPRRSPGRLVANLAQDIVHDVKVVGQPVGIDVLDFLGDACRVHSKPWIRTRWFCIEAKLSNRSPSSVAPGRMAGGPGEPGLSHIPEQFRRIGPCRWGVEQGTCPIRDLRPSRSRKRGLHAVAVLLELVSLIRIVAPEKDLSSGNLTSKIFQAA